MVNNKLSQELMAMRMSCALNAAISSGSGDEDSVGRFLGTLGPQIIAQILEPHYDEYMSSSYGAAVGVDRLGDLLTMGFVYVGKLNESMIDSTVFCKYPDSYSIFSSEECDYAYVYDVMSYTTGLTNVKLDALKQLDLETLEQDPSFDIDNLNDVSVRFDFVLLEQTYGGYDLDEELFPEGDHMLDSDKDFPIP